MTPRTKNALWAAGTILVLATGYYLAMIASGVWR